MNIRQIIVAVLLSGFLTQMSWAGGKPVYVGFDAEIGHKTSTSDDAIRVGLQIAIDEINAKGGVLDGRPLKLVEKDNRSVPARGVENIKQLAAMEDLVAVFCGKFSPVVLEAMPVIHSEKLPLLDPWAAADGIIDNDYSPKYAFRLSLKDSWAVEAMLRYLQGRKLNKIGMLLPNTAWGRSSQAAMEKATAGKSVTRLVKTEWYNWGDQSLLNQYHVLRAAGANAVVLVANENEGALLIKEVAALPKDQRLSIVSHWGVSGGDLAGMVGPAMKDVDFVVVQTFSFIGNNHPVAKNLGEEAMKRLGKSDIRQVLSPVGVAHAYDLMHILALAINHAGSIDRQKIRSELERVKNYRGAIKHYAQPFTANNHEALSLSDVFMARYPGEGAPVPMRTGK